MGCLGAILFVTAVFQAAGSTAGASPLFTDVTAEAGIRLNVERRPNRPQYGTQRPHGVAVEDFDEDGKFDVVVVCFGEPHVRLFRNLGDLRFSDITEGSGLETFRGWGSGAAAGDYNRDGNLDLYLASVAPVRKRKSGPKTDKESRLYRGLGNGRFEDVSRESGTLLDVPARSCAWSDIDGDGWLDLFICCPRASNVLFKNLGDGTFTDIAEEAGVGLEDRISLGCAFGDVQGDGLDDLFVTNYRSQADALFKNLGDCVFKEVTGGAGLARKASSVGCVFADVFNNGWLDLYVTTDSWLSGANYTENQLLERGHTVEPNMLYANHGTGRFEPVGEETIKHKTISHDAVLEDLDHDGLIDIYVGVDAIPTGNRFATDKGGNPAWTRGDGRSWKQVRSRWNAGFEGNCVCVPAADFDNDGDLDLLLINFYRNLVLYRNNTGGNNWLRVKPAGVRSNIDGIGARVRLYATSSGKRDLVGMRHIQSGGGYGRSSPLEAHFGLGGPLTSQYRVEVFFPATRTLVVKKHVRPGRRIVVKETSEDG